MSISVCIPGYDEWTRGVDEEGDVCEVPPEYFDNIGHDNWFSIVKRLGFNHLTECYSLEGLELDQWIKALFKAKNSEKILRSFRKSSTQIYRCGTHHEVDVQAVEDVDYFSKKLGILHKIAVFAREKGSLVYIY